MLHSFAVSEPKMAAASTPIATNRDRRLSAGLAAGRWAAAPARGAEDPRPARRRCRATTTRRRS
ncbi:MAG: hypothetical protein ACLSVD_19210 [Eggerthellaceae bacterium]